MLEREKIEVGKIFENKTEIFELFQSLIKEETFETISQYTDNVSLNKINEHFQENYMYINIIPEIDGDYEYKNTFEEDEKIWLRDSQLVDLLEECCNVLYNAEFVFLFKEENEKYRFLGLYQIMEIDTEGYLITWERQCITSISLEEKILKKEVEKINTSGMEEALKDRNKLKKLLEKDGKKYKHLPENFKEDEELCLLARKNGWGICQYAGKKLLDNKEFAKKFFKEFHYDLRFFSDEIKNDLDFCKSIDFDYREAGPNVRKDKELALQKIQECAWNVRYVDKNLRKDKEIIETFWSELWRKQKKNSYLLNMCSIIGIDDFGKKIIDQFLQIEKRRHSVERITKYEEQTELVQFVKIQKNNNYQELEPMITIFDKEIFDTEWEPLIVLIGEKENIVSKQLREKYQKNEKEKCFIIEIYSQDSETYNPKLITKDVDQIMDLLRVLTYDASSKTISMFEDTLESIKRIFEESNETYALEVQKFQGTIKEVKQKLNEIPKSRLPQEWIVQVIFPSKMDDYTVNGISKMLFSLVKNKIIRYCSYHECEIDEVEIIIVKMNY